MSPNQAPTGICKADGMAGFDKDPSLDTANTIASAVIPGNSSNMCHCCGKPSVESYKARTSCKASDLVSRSGGDDTAMDHLAS